MIEAIPMASCPKCGESCFSATGTLHRLAKGEADAIAWRQAALSIFITHRQVIGDVEQKAACSRRREADVMRAAR